MTCYHRDETASWKSFEAFGVDIHKDSIGNTRPMRGKMSLEPPEAHSALVVGTLGICNIWNNLKPSLKRLKTYCPWFGLAGNANKTPPGTSCFWAHNMVGFPDNPTIEVLTVSQTLRCCSWDKTTFSPFKVVGAKIHLKISNRRRIQIPAYQLIETIRRRNSNWSSKMDYGSWRKNDNLVADFFFNRIWWMSRGW